MERMYDNSRGVGELATAFGIIASLAIALLVYPAPQASAQIQLLGPLTTLPPCKPPATRHPTRV